MTDLDLNFLLSQSAFNSEDDDDDDLRISYRRTVDDILNDSDSSSSSVSSISRSNRLKNSDSFFLDDGQSKISSSDHDFNNRSRVRSSFEEKRVESSPMLSIDGRFNRFFPPLFGIGRQNVSKPGAALAAATAASRSNSAVFRLRRGGSEPQQKILLDRNDLGSSTSFIGGIESGGNGAIEVLSEIEVERIEDVENLEEDLRSEFVNEEHVLGQTINSDLEVIVSSNINVEKYSLLNSKTVENSEISASTEVDGDHIIWDSENQVRSNLIGNTESTVKICLEEKSTAAISHLEHQEESNYIENRESTKETCLKPNLRTDISSSEVPKTNFIGNNDNCLNEQSITTFLSSEDPENVTDDPKEAYSGTADRIDFSEDLIAENVKNESHLFMKSLQFAEELEKKQASTAFHLEKGAVALPMRLEGGKNISSVVGYFDIDSANVMTHIISSETFRQNYGSPSSFDVHPSFVAIGMSKGVIVIHNICSTHSANVPNTEVTMLGLQGDKTHSPITSIHFNKQGDLLLAGYGDGHVTFWDVQRRSPVKVITGEHSVAVEHTIFVGQDSQNTKQFKALSTDSKGLVLLHTISVSVVPLRNRFSIKTLRFREESIGVVLSVSPLTCDEFYSDISAIPSGTSGVISTSSLSSLMGGVVGVDSGWKFFGESPSLGEENIMLLVMFPTYLMFQLSPTFEVCAQLPKPEGVHNSMVPCTSWRYLLHNQTDGDEKNNAKGSDSELMLAITWEKIVQVAKLIKYDVKICNEWTLEESAIGVAWLDDQMLVVLTSSYQLYLFTVNGYLVYKTCYSLDEQLLHTNMDNIHVNAEKTYHNVLVVTGSTIFVLGSMFLVVCRLLSWKERIQVLRKSGDWMSALNMGMTIFDGDAHGIIDLPKSKNALQEVVMNYLAELLLCYVDESISYISVMSENQMEDINRLLDSDVSGSYLEAKEQFSHVGGVVVEFCVHLNKTDILYDEVFTKFISAGHKDTFLELLEPYILKDMLGSLPPEIMQALVEHYNSKGWLQRVEQCILHMDISSVDFNQVVKLCREHGLYGALIYLFNRGLDDFKAPLEELLLLLRNSGPDSASALGYKILVYLKYCFTGLTFPPGHGILNPSRIPSLRMELILFLLEDINIEISETLITSNKNIYHLLLLNTEATLDVLKCAFLKVEVPEKGVGGDEEQEGVLVQSTVDTLVGLLTEPMAASDKVGLGIYEWPSEEEKGYLLDFIAYCVSCRRASVSKIIVSMMVEHFTRDVYGNVNMHLKHRERQRHLHDVLEVIPKHIWEEIVVLHHCEKARFFQVSGFVHTCEKRYVSALDSYMKEEEEPAHAFIFINRTLSILHQNECAAFRSEVMSRISDLINLNREGAYFMIAENFSKESQTSIISKLESYPKSLFLYLKTVIELYSSDKLNFSSLRNSVIPDGSTRDELESYFKWIENLAKISWNNSVSLTDDIVNLYLELLCQYEKESVLGFLQRFERYQIEKCLRICLKYEVADACAFLLERVGDIGRALSFTISCLNTQFKALDAAVATVVSYDVSPGFHSGMISEENPILQLKEVNNINDTLNTCIGLCQRNTPRMDPNESELLWFSLLNAFCAPMADADDSQIEIITWKIPEAEGAYTNAHSVLRNIFSHFLKQVVEGMTGYVPLPLIVSKLLYRKGCHEFGDFRTALLGMLYSYGFERRILETVKLLIEDDMFFTVSTLKKGASHGYAPPLMQCSVCNLVLAAPSPASQIQVFGCGHVAHLNCEASGNRASTVGCPLCVPKKKSVESKEKRVLTDDGLVRGSQAGGVMPHLNTGLYPHDSTEMLENSYKKQQMSRFEILCELWKEEMEGGIRSRNKPQLRLAPPPIYHDKVRSSNILTKAGSSGGTDTKVDGSALNQPPKNRRNSTLPSLRLPLKSTIFGK